MSSTTHCLDIGAEKNYVEKGNKVEKKREGKNIMYYVIPTVY